MSIVYIIGLMILSRVIYCRAGDYLYDGRYLLYYIKLLNSVYVFQLRLVYWGYLL